MIKTKCLELRGRNDLILLCVIFLVALPTIVHSQDVIRATIHENNKTSIEVCIEKIGVEAVEYRLRNISEEGGKAYGPVREIHKKDIWRIDYEDGSSETFPEFQEPGSSQTKLTLAPVPELPVIVEKQPAKTNTSEEVVENSSSYKGFCFGGKAGLYIPYAQSISEIYGPGFMGGLLVGYWAVSWGVEVDWRYFSKKGDPYTYGPVDNASSHIILSPLTLTGYYNVFKRGNLETYVGLGAGACFIEEEISMTALGTTETGGVNITAFEFHSTGGIKFAPFYVELSFLSITHPDYDVNFGGFLVSGGIFF